MRLALGTAQFGLDYGISNSNGMVQESQVARILWHARDNAIDTIDTAQAYGHSEVVLGQHDLSPFKVVTKIAPHTARAQIRPAVEQSLRRLNLTGLHGLLFHRFEDFLDGPDVFEDLIELQRCGMVARIGFSLYRPSELEYLLNKEVPFTLLQIPFSVFDQRFRNYFDDLRKRGTEVHVRSVYLQGLVFLDPDAMHPFFHGHRRVFQQLRDFCVHRGVSVSRLCLQFVHSFRQIDRIIVGISSLRELENNTEEASASLPDMDAVLPQLEALAITDENIILPFNWKLT